MRKPRVIVALIACGSVAVLACLGVRAFQPPLSLAKLDAVKAGMSASQVRELLGAPTQVCPSQSYVVRGTNYQTGEQWTYQRALTFGYVNVLFDTNGVVEFGHYEPF